MKKVTVVFLTLILLLGAVPLTSFADLKEKVHVVSIEEREIALPVSPANAGMTGLYNLDTKFGAERILRFETEITVNSGSKAIFMLSGKKNGSSVNNKIIADFGTTHANGFAINGTWSRFGFVSGHKYKVVIEFDFVNLAFTVTDLTTGNVVLTPASIGYNTTFHELTSLTIKSADDHAPQFTVHKIMAAYITYEEDDGEDPTVEPPVEPGDETVTIVKQETDALSIGSGVWALGGLNFGNNRLLRFEIEFTPTEGSKPVIQLTGRKGDKAATINKEIININDKRPDRILVTPGGSNYTYTPGNRYYISFDLDILKSQIYVTIKDLTTDVFMVK